MKKRNRLVFWAVFVGAICLAMFLLPKICSADTTILEEIYSMLEGYQSEWLKKLAKAIWWTFGALLTISFVWQGSQMVLSDSVSLGAMTGLIVRTGMYAGFFKWIFENPNYVMMIPDSFVKLSETVTGYTVDIFNLLNIAGNMMGVLGELQDALSWYMKIVGALAIIITNAMLYAIVGIILMLKIEVAMVTLAGFSLLVFCGLNTLMSDYAMTYVKALIGCGLKLFMCGIVGGMLQDFCKKFVTMATASSSEFLSLVSVLLGILVVLWIIVSNIPNYVSAIFYGVPAGSMGTAISSAMTVMSVAKSVAQGAAHVGKGAGDVVAGGVAGTGW